jgi:hypothetical protein
MQSLQRMMGASARSEAVAEAEEIGFINGAQHLGDRALGNFVLQRGNTKGPATRRRLSECRCGEPVEADIA